MNNQVKVEIDDTMDRSELFGIMDGNLKIIKDNFSVEIIQRGNEITLTGDDAEKAGTVITEMLGIIASGEKIDSQKINYIMTLAEKGVSYQESSIGKDIVCYTHMGKPIRPKTLGQKSYVASIKI